MPDILNRVTGTYSLVNNTTEQTAITITPAAVNVLKGIWLDLVNLTQSNTIRIKYRIDGTNLRTFDTINWFTGMDDGVLLEGDIPVRNVFALTLQAGALETAARDVYYEYWYAGQGLGTISWSYTLTDSVTGLPIDGATIEISTDTSKNNIIASGVTNSSGVFGPLQLDPGTIYIWRSRSGYNFSPEPDVEVVS